MAVTSEGEYFAGMRGDWVPLPRKVRPGPVRVVVRRRSHRIFALLDASTVRAAAIDVATVEMERRSGERPEGGCRIGRTGHLPSVYPHRYVTTE